MFCICPPQEEVEWQWGLPTGSWQSSRRLLQNSAIDKRRRPQQEREWQWHRRQDDGNRTTATGRRQQDDGNRTTATGRRWQDGGKTATAMKMKEASSWFSYFYSTCYAVSFYFLFFPAKILFFDAHAGTCHFWHAFASTAENWLKNLISSWSAKFKGYFNPILNFEFLNFFKKCFLLFQFKVSQLGDWVGNIFTSKADILE